jgi:hypothetical protein
VNGVIFMIVQFQKPQYEVKANGNQRSLHPSH